MIGLIVAVVLGILLIGLVLKLLKFRSSSRWSSVD